MSIEVELPGADLRYVTVLDADGEVRCVSVTDLQTHLLRLANIADGADAHPDVGDYLRVIVRQISAET